MLKLKMVSGGGVGEVGLDGDCPRRILFVVLGSGEVLVAGERFVFAGGSVFFIAGGVGFEVVSGEVLVGHYFCFDSGYVDYFLLQYPLGRGLGLFSDLVFLEVSSVRLALVLERIRVLGAEVDRGAGFEHLKLLFSLFLFDVVGDRFVVALPYDENGRLFVEFRELLEVSFKVSRATSYYVRRLGVSRKRLNLLCRGWYNGKGVFAVIMDRLLSEAEFLLLGTDLPIKSIAYELGFSSHENFGTYFKRFRGVTPLQFRVAGQGRL